MTATKTDKPKGLLPRTGREQVDAIAMAICLAIGLKYFLVEAYEIPTPSMQPTLMGSAKSGVHDRILVNKAAWLMRKPQRFDIAVFRFPHNRSQNYVKRIWGLGGEHISILGGNVYKIHDGDSQTPDRYECLSKPERVQAGLWRRVYDERGDQRTEKDWRLQGSTGRWSFGSEGLNVEDTGNGARRVFVPGQEREGDLMENVYQHGYPKSIIKQIAQEARPPDNGYRKVGDLRWNLEIQPNEKTEQIQISEKEIYTQDGSRTQLLHRIYRFTVTRQASNKAKIRLEILEKAQGGARERVTDHVEATGIDIPADESFDLGITKVDGVLTALLAGKPFGRLLVGWKGRPHSVALVSLELAVKGKGQLRVLRNRLDRDIYYTNNRDNPTNVSDVRVPKGHCWMLGDNTQNSADGRAWKTITVRVSKEGRLLGLDSKEGREITGNERFHNGVAVWPPDPDENPVVIPIENPGEGPRYHMVLTDIWGEEHVFKADIHELEALSRTKMDLFVPEQNIIGRAFATFWPAVPWGQFRVGLIR